MSVCPLFMLLYLKQVKGIAFVVDLFKTCCSSLSVA